VTDAAALVDKLEAVGGVTSEQSSQNTPRSAALLQTLIQRYENTFRQRITVMFDGHPVQPMIRSEVSGEATATSSPGAVIKLSGAVPEGAGQFAWTYGWTFATYAMTVDGSGATTSTQWLEGGQSSVPVSVVAAESHHNRVAIAVQYLALG